MVAVSHSIHDYNLINIPYIARLAHFYVSQTFAPFSTGAVHTLVIKLIRSLLVNKLSNSMIGSAFAQ